jgi:hypothetical protein
MSERDEIADLIYDGVESEASTSEIADAILALGYRKGTEVFRLSWDGEPKMGGGFHRQSVGVEFPTFALALNAAKSTGMDKRAGFRVDKRSISEWVEGVVE